MTNHKETIDKFGNPPSLLSDALRAADTLLAENEELKAKLKLQEIQLTREVEVQKELNDDLKKLGRPTLDTIMQIQQVMNEITTLQLENLELLAENEALKARLEWQPIETAPRDGTEILVSEGYSVCTAIYKKSNVLNHAPFFVATAAGEVFNTGRDWEDEPLYIDVTHWMHLPQPPKEEANDRN